MDALPPGDALAEDLAAIEATAANIGIREGDPAYPFVRGLARVLGSFARRLDAYDVRPLIGPDDLAKLARASANGADRRAAELARTHNWRTLAVLAVVGLCLLLTGIGTGWLARGDGVARACVSGGEIRADKDGRKFCVFWLDPAPQVGQGR